jgi:hypothetical protein
MVNFGMCSSIDLALVDKSSSVKPRVFNDTSNPKRLQVFERCLKSFLIKFAIIALAAYTAIAEPGKLSPPRVYLSTNMRLVALPLPITGKYRIQNAETGLFMDAEYAQQGKSHKLSCVFVLMMDETCL